jgi:hypothetical protein
MSALAPDMTVTLNDGTDYRVENSMVDLMAWERYAVAHGLEPMGVPITMMMFYCWRGARKHGICPQDVDLDTFAARIDGFELDDDEPPNPTQPGHGDG